MRFLFYSEFGETADLAIHLLHVEGHEVILHIYDSKHQRIAEGIVPHITDWYTHVGSEWIWVFDSCRFGKLQDWLREQGEWVVGGSFGGDELENDRQLGQGWFRDLGFDQPFSKNFTSVDEALAFVEEHSDQRWILKQNGDAPKHISHLGKFPNSEDMIFHLRELKKGWNEQEFGKFDCDLMEVVEGMEIAASAFFNGEGWLKNHRNQVCGFLNFEEKKEGDGGLGETCGEMGTTFIGVDETNELFSEILLRDGVASRLSEIGFRGVFDINCILQADGNLVALEPTCRFGVPASSYEFIEGLDSPCGELLSAMAKGINRTIEIQEGPGMVMCVVAKPFPLEVDVEPDGTSEGERLWILQDGEPSTDFTEDQMQHIHLYNFEKTEDMDTGEICYKVPTKGGYMLTVTRRGESIESTRQGLIDYIKENVFISGMKYRTDIGKRVEAFEGELHGIATAK